MAARISGATPAALSLAKFKLVPGVMNRRYERHREERSDEAIQDLDVRPELLRFARNDDGHESSACRIVLHAARIGGGLATAAVARGGGEAAFRPVRPDLDDV